MRLMSINVGRIKDNVLCLKIKKLWRSITLLMSGLTFTDLDYVMMGLQNYVNLEFWIHLLLFFILKLWAVIGHKVFRHLGDALYIDKMKWGTCQRNY